MKKKLFRHLICQKLEKLLRGTIIMSELDKIKVRKTLQEVKLVHSHKGQGKEYWTESVPNISYLLNE